MKGLDEKKYYIPSEAEADKVANLTSSQRAVMLQVPKPKEAKAVKPGNLDVRSIFEW